MSDRVDETKGKVKEGAGKLIGDEKMEVEGRAESESAEAKREAKGAANQVKGSVQETVGKVTGNEQMQAEGTADASERRKPAARLASYPPEAAASGTIIRRNPHRPSPREAADRCARCVSCCDSPPSI